MRLANRLLAVLVALALIALAVLVPVEALRAALGKPHWVLPWETWTRTLAANTWRTGWARAVLIGLAVVGLLLLLAELKPRRPGLLPLARLTDNVQAGTTRRSLQQVLCRAAAEVDGVTQASVKARRRRVKVTAASRLRDPGGLDQRVRDQVTERLTSLQLAAQPRLTVKVRGGGR